jgi:cytochrome c-type biogenesis protein CcmE
MKAGHKFLLGAVVIVGAVSFLMIEGVRQTGVYFLTPTFYDVGIKVGAKVVPGTIVRSADHRRIDFRISDGTTEYPVTYTGTVPDTFTDANDIEVVVEGRLQKDGVLHASDVLAKCGSRYEAVPTAT